MFLSMLLLRKSALKTRAFMAACAQVWFSVLGDPSAGWSNSRQVSCSWGSSSSIFLNEQVV